jgi:hypothetical protein
MYLIPKIAFSQSVFGSTSPSLEEEAILFTFDLVESLRKEAQLEIKTYADLIDTFWIEDLTNDIDIFDTKGFVFLSKGTVLEVNISFDSVKLKMLGVSRRIYVIYSINRIYTYKIVDNIIIIGENAKVAYLEDTYLFIKDVNDSIYRKYRLEKKIPSEARSVNLFKNQKSDL